MIDLPAVCCQLAANAAAIRALAQAFPEEGASWSPGPEAWSMQQVMEHLYNEERIDFRRHLKEMFGEGPQPREPHHPADAWEALDGFLAEREASIAWLAALDAPDWDIVTQRRFGPLSAGDILLSWVEHDYLHLRQLVELLHGRHVEQVPPYSVRYAGEW